MSRLPNGRRSPRSGLVLRRLVSVAALLVGASLLAFGLFLGLTSPLLADFDPEPWTPPPERALIDARIEVVSARPIAGPINGPEDIAVDGAGRLITGDRDGILWRIAEGGAATFADTGGRPLGLVFAPDGRLLVANHGLGLQAVTPDGGVSTLVSTAFDIPVSFANDLDVSPGGIVYFSDSSTRYNTRTLGPDSPSYLLPDAIEGRPTGRVLAHDLRSGRTWLVADGLYFPNGIALSTGGDRLWVAESNRYRILELDLTGARPPRVLIDRLPGTPDNLDRQADGSLLLAYYDRSAPLDRLVLPYALGRQILARLPVGLFINEENPRPGGVLVLEPSGRVRAQWRGLAPAPTSVIGHGDAYYIGALLGQPIRQLEVPADAR